MMSIDTLATYVYISRHFQLGIVNYNRSSKWCITAQAQPILQANQFSVMDQSEQDPMAKRRRSERHFCPHCKHIVSKSTYYRHQTLHFEESQGSEQTALHEVSFEFEEGTATGKRILSH